MEIDIRTLLGLLDPCPAAVVMVVLHRGFDQPSHLCQLRLLADTATRVEGDALARLESVGGDDLGELVVWVWVVEWTPFNVQLCLQS